MTTKYMSGLYEYYPGERATVRHNTPGDKEQKQTQDDISNKKSEPESLPTTMRKLKTHVDSSLKNMKTVEYPEGSLLASTIDDIRSILNIMETMQEHLLRHQRVLAMVQNPRTS